jgi:recombination protein RecA
VFIDAEHALDATFAEAIGVRTADLLISQPDSGEQALAVADTFIRSGSVDVVVVDSVSGATPRGTTGRGAGAHACCV